MKRRSILTAALVAILTAAISLAVVGTAAAQTPKRGGKLVYIVPASGLPSMDAHRETTYAVIHPVAPFYSLMIRIDPTDPKGERIEGDAAESWVISPDKKTYTFKIRRNIRFHDGTPLKARDVVATYKKIIFPEKGVLSARVGYFKMVESVTNPDDSTVVFKLKFASPALLPALAMPYNFIYSADILAKDMHWFEKNVMGSGPFKNAKFTPGSNMIGERNDDYFKPGLPYLDSIEAIFTKKQSIQVTAIRGRRAMVNFRAFPPATVDDIVRGLGKENVTVQESTWNCALFVTPNSHRKPFDDPRVRRAINLAIDRWGGSQYLSRIAIVKTVGGLVFPGHPLAMTDSELEQELEGFGRDMKANRAKARQLLKEAGQEGLKFTFHNRAVEQPYKIVGTWLIDQWRRVGMKVDQWVQPTAQFYKTLRSNPPGYDVSMDFNCQAIVNPTLDMSKFLSWDAGGGSNNGKYIDREIDKLFDQQLREPDQAKQKQILVAYQKRIINEKAFYFPTLWWNRIVPHNAKLKGWNITASHYLNQQLEVVWLDQ